MEWITDSQIWISLITLTALEIILGIDNIVVISLLSSKLPVERQRSARMTGIGLAVITRILFLLSITWIASLTDPLLHLFGHPISARDMILIIGGLFLIWKGTHEIHAAFDSTHDKASVSGKSTMAAVVTQILVLDIIFSIDSVITAVGMAQEVGVMIAAVIIALMLMLVASEAISAFIHRHPSLKILALSFLLMIGLTLVAEGMSFHIPKGYIYFAMGFSAAVETLNIMTGTRRAKRSSSSRS